MKLILTVCQSSLLALPQANSELTYLLFLALYYLSYTQGSEETALVKLSTKEHVSQTKPHSSEVADMAKEKSIPETILSSTGGQYLVKSYNRTIIIIIMLEGPNNWYKAALLKMIQIQGTRSFSKEAEKRYIKLILLENQTGYPMTYATCFSRSSKACKF